MKSSKDMEIFRLSYYQAVKVHKFFLTPPKYEQYDGRKGMEITHTPTLTTRESYCATRNPKLVARL